MVEREGGRVLAHLQTSAAAAGPLIILVFGSHVIVHRSPFEQVAIGER